MAKIQNIYAIASDGTKITVTASAVGAVPTDQVATSSVLGLVKTGDNTVQGQENGIDVNYLEVNAAGKGFMPAFNISNYIAGNTGGKYFKVCFKPKGYDVIWTFIAKDTPTQDSDGTYHWYDDPKDYYTLVTTYGDSSGYHVSYKKAVTYTYATSDSKETEYSPVVYYKDTAGNENGVPLLDIILGDGNFEFISAIYVDYKYYQTWEDRRDAETGSQTFTNNIGMGIMFNEATWDTFTGTDGGNIISYVHPVNVTDITDWKQGTPNDDNMLIFCDILGNDFYIDVNDISTKTINEKVYATYLNEVFGTFAEPISAGSATPNRVILNGDKKLVVDVDNFQHATTSQYGIVQFPADYYEDDGTPKIATTDKQGTLKIGTEYSAYTTEGSYTAAPLLLNSSNVGYVEVLPATTTAIGSIMVSNAETYDASAISNKTIAWVNLKDNKAFVYVNLAATNYRGSVRVQQKYTAYSTLDSQTAAYLRITDAGFGYVTVLPATTSTLGSFKASSAKYYDYNSTIGYTVAWVNINSNDLAYVVVKPATSSTLGCVIVSNKYTAYSTEDSQTAAYLRINSAGKAYTPMLTEAWTFTVLNDDDTETDVVKNVVLG